MTQAVCYACGEIKFGAFMECPACNARPMEDEDLVRSLAMTDHFLDLATLKQVGEAIKCGKPPRLDEKSRQDLLAQLENIRKTPIGRFIGGGDRASDKSETS